MLIHRLIPLVVLLLTIPGTISVLGQGTRVNVLYTGDPYPGETPYIYMKSEPMLITTPIQASKDYLWGIYSSSEIERAIRLYMPRSYSSLLDQYDVVIVSDANVASFTDDHLEWFKRGVSNQALALVMIGGHETYGTNGHHPDWGQTPVGQVLPVKTVYGGYEGGKLKILDSENPFMRSLPWRPDLNFLQRYASNMVEEKPGAEVLAVATVTQELVYERKYLNWKNPFFSTWNFNDSGRVFAMTGDWTPGGGARFLEWDYIQDFVTNLMLYCTGNDIPKDLDLVHTVRSRITSFSNRKLIITSLVDFVDNFGADPSRVLKKVEEVDRVAEKARDLYLQQDFSGALEAIDRALGMMEEAENLAQEVKDSALLWIYVSEWLAVTGASLICGFLLWTLMVRRRLYREVTTTRLD